MLVQHQSRCKERRRRTPHRGMLQLHLKPEQGATVQAHLLLRSRFSELRRPLLPAIPRGGPPSAGSAPEQVQRETAQNTAQGDAATPLETRARRRADAEKQRAAEATAA